MPSIATPTDQIVLSESPLNSEPNPHELIKHLYTPTTNTYNRNHGDPLHLDPATYTLAFDCPDHSLKLRPQQLSLADITAFDKTDVAALLMCAGNRRKEMDDEKQVEGLLWDRAALANPKWAGQSRHRRADERKEAHSRREPTPFDIDFAGTLLRDVLLKWGVPPDGSYDGLHLHAETSQKCEEDSWYGASIPLSLAMCVPPGL